MVHVYLYQNPEKRERNHAWQHETGLKLLTYAESLLEKEGLKFYNISHSGIYVAVALADVPVGVDVEINRELSDRVANRVFSKKERSLLNKEGSYTTPIQLWTLKESYGKSKGVGIAYPLNEVEFAPLQCYDKWQSFACSDPNVRCYSRITDDHALSVCAQTRVEVKPELQLLQNIPWM